MRSSWPVSRTFPKVGRTPPLIVEGGLRTRHRLFGANALPQEIWIDTLDDALAIVGKRRDAIRFKDLIDLTRARQPPLLAWLAKRPLRALELADEWRRLLDIVAWLQAHPRPGVYLR